MLNYYNQRYTQRRVKEPVFQFSFYLLYSIDQHGSTINNIPYTFCNYSILCNVLFQESIKISDGILEEKPLWEYPSKGLSNAYDLFTLNFENIANESSLILKNSLSVKIKKQVTEFGIYVYIMLN